MDDEEVVRELIGRMSAAQRQGFHVTPAMIAHILTALRFYLAARTWLARPHDNRPDQVRTKPEKHTGPPATIADLGRNGLIACTITCDGPNCWNSKRVMFDDLGLDDTMVFTSIPQHRPFRCQKCGCHRVRISPDWTDHVAPGNGRPGAAGKPAG